MFQSALIADRCSLTGLAAGFHGLLRLPDGTVEVDAVRAAAERSVALRGLEAFLIRFPAHPAIVLRFGNAANDRLASGIRVIADLLR